jgi:acyl-CoA synthetase (NDP forming)
MHLRRPPTSRTTDDPAGVPPLIADTAAVLAYARMLERESSSGSVHAWLRGKNIGSLAGAGNGTDEALFRQAATELGAQVTPIRPFPEGGLAPSEIQVTARLIGTAVRRSRLARRVERAAAAHPFDRRHSDLRRARRRAPPDRPPRRIARARHRAGRSAPIRLAGGAARHDDLTHERPLGGLTGGSLHSAQHEGSPMSVRHLDCLLEPRRIAVIGASNRPASVGATVWRNLRAGGHSGPIRAVNPKHRRLDGEPVAARVADLPEVPDLAVICTPPATVAGLIDELGRFGTHAAIVMTAGLDAAQKQAMLDAARPHLLRVPRAELPRSADPRTSASTRASRTPTRWPATSRFISQSGALVTAVLDWAKSRRIGFSHMVSLGEHADVDFGDLLDHLASEARTRSILLYVESVEAARKFMSAARSAARNKPVVIVKAGRAGHGVQAAASHTGALTGSDIVFDAAIRRAGMLRVDTLQDLFMAAETLARFGKAHDGALTMMTNGGGAGVMAADAAALAGVPLRDLGDDLTTRLDLVLPPTWSRANPIDIIGDAPVERYVATLQALLAEPDGGAVLFMHAPTAIVRSDDIARACAPLVRSGAGRVMACWLGDAAVADARRIPRRRRRGRLRDPRGGGARVRAAVDVPAQPDAAARGTDRQRKRCARRRRSAPAGRYRARGRPHDARRIRGEGAAAGLRHSDRRNAHERTRCRRGGGHGGGDRLPGRVEDPLARDQPQDRGRRRRARPRRWRGGAARGRGHARPRAHATAARPQSPASRCSASSSARSPRS